MTLGVEYEMQLLDPETRDLRPASIEILDRLPTDLRAFIKAEIFQSMIELNSPVGKTPQDLRQAMLPMLQSLRAAAGQAGVDMATAGTHPFADYVGRKIYPSARFHEVIDRNQWISRRLVIFGLHIHMGIRNDDEFFRLFTGLQWYLPALLAVSASSPYWLGQDTGLQSTRMSVFETIPTGGHPCHIESMEEYREMYDGLLRSKAIGSHKDLWWDLRPSPAYGTLEVRMPDMSPRLDDNLLLAGFLQALAAGILEGAVVPPGICPDWAVRENKWRAGRHALEADLIVDRQGNIQSCREMLTDLGKKLSGVAHRLGTEGEIKAFLENLQRPGSAERQRAVYHQSNDFRSVVDLLKAEFESSLVGRTI